MKNQKAFTLVEILIVLAIFSLISLVVIGGLFSGNKIRDTQESIIEIQQNMRVAMILMTRDIRMAGFELAPHWGSGQQRTLNQLVGGVCGLNNRSNSLQLSYLAATTTTGIPNSPATVTYSLDVNGNLTRTYNDGVNLPPSTDTIATNVDAMWFSYLDNSGIWNPMPVNPPTVMTTSWAGVPVTRAIAVTIVAKGSKPDKNDGNVTYTFTEPNLPAGVAPSIPCNDGYAHRMVSTIIQLNNLNSRI